MEDKSLGQTRAIVSGHHYYDVQFCEVSVTKLFPASGREPFLALALPCEENELFLTWNPMQTEWCWVLCFSPVRVFNQAPFLIKCMDTMFTFNQSNVEEGHVASCMFLKVTPAEQIWKPCPQDLSVTSPDIADNGKHWRLLQTLQLTMIW